MFTMTNLSELYSIKKFNTDKGECHNYIDGYYNQEFSDRQNNNIKILEIGLAYGGSARLWREWFSNAEIHFIENDVNLIQSIKGVNIFWGDAYSKAVLDCYYDSEFDYIIDDGPHTIESNLFVINHWIKKLKPNGKIIIEDIQKLEWLDIFKKSTQYLSRVIDLRETKGRSDDIIFEITKIR
jgi:hypothetical protein